MNNDIVEFIAESLNYLGDPRYPEVSGIRNVRRVPSDEQSYGYSYIYEACVAGEWISYGPELGGNWSVRSGLKWQLPDSERMEFFRSTETIYIGFHALDKQFRGLPLEEQAPKRHRDGTGEKQR